MVDFSRDFLYSIHSTTPVEVFSLAWLGAVMRF